MFIEIKKVFRNVLQANNNICDTCGEIVGSGKIHFLMHCRYMWEVCGTCLETFLRRTWIHAKSPSICLGFGTKTKVINHQDLGEVVRSLTQIFGTTEEDFL